MDLSCMNRNYNPLDLWRCSRYKRNDTGMPCSGILLFCGVQGSGKTYSMANYVINLSRKYPKAIICSNLAIDGINTVPYLGVISLTSINNGEDGVIYVIDEIQLEFNSLESRQIGIEVMIEVSQQRKQRKHIVGTTQVFGRVAKPIREQIKWVVLCKCYLRLFQINKLINGEESEEVDGKLKTKTKSIIFDIHKVEYYKRYDTYAKIQRINDIYKGVLK